MDKHLIFFHVDHHGFVPIPDRVAAIHDVAFFKIAPVSSGPSSLSSSGGMAVQWGQASTVSGQNGVVLVVPTVKVNFQGSGVRNANDGGFEPSMVAVHGIQFVVHTHVFQPALRTFQNHVFQLAQASVLVPQSFFGLGVFIPLGVQNVFDLFVLARGQVVVEMFSFVFERAPKGTGVGARHNLFGATVGKVVRQPGVFAHPRTRGVGATARQIADDGFQDPVGLEIGAQQGLSTGDTGVVVQVEPVVNARVAEHMAARCTVWVGHDVLADATIEVGVGCGEKHVERGVVKRGVTGHGGCGGGCVWGRPELGCRRGSGVQDGQWFVLVVLWFGVVWFGVVWFVFGGGGGGVSVNGCVNGRIGSCRRLVLFGFLAFDWIFVFVFGSGVSGGGANGCANRHGWTGSYRRLVLCGFAFYWSRIVCGRQVGRIGECCGRCVLARQEWDRLNV